MLWIRDGVGLNISNTMRVLMMDLFRANGGSDLTKEWTNISDTVRLHELETEDGCNMFKKILDKSYPLIN